MPAPRFVTSDNFGAPGLYIREQPPTPIVKGVQRNMVGIAGVCVRGPKDKAVEVNSPGRFLEVFGGRDYGSGGALVGEIWKALLNKQWGKLAIVRAVASDAVKASFTFESAAGGAGTAILTATASSEGAWGNDVGIKISDATDGNANHFNLTTRYLGKFKTYENLDASAGNDNLALKIGGDDGRLIDLTKEGDGRPVNTAADTDGADADGYVELGTVVATFTSVAGDDGTIADSDFTAANRALDVLAGYKGIGIAFVAGRSNAAIKAALLVKAAASSDRDFLCCPDTSAITEAAAITERATLADDRMIYCFNHPTTLDPETAGTITVEPHAWMANILGQTDADVHPGVEDNRPFLAGITGLTYENLAPGDYDSLHDANICALERKVPTDIDPTTGFGFVDGVCTDGTQIDVRRTNDYLISGLAGRMVVDKYRSNTKTRRNDRRAAMFAWLAGLANQERMVDKLADGSPAVELKNDDSVNTQSDRDAGIQKDVVRIKLIAKNLWLVLVYSGSTGELISATTVAG